MRPFEICSILYFVLRDGGNRRSRFRPSRVAMKPYGGWLFPNSKHFQRTCLGRIRRVGEVENDVFPIVFLVFLCVSASPFHPLTLLREYSSTHMCNTMLHGWLCQKSRRILSVSFSVMCILPRFCVIPFLSDLSSCWTCQWHVMWHVCCMMHAWCMHVHHHMTSHDILYSSLGTLRNSFQPNWQPMFTPTTISLKSKMTLSSSGSVNFKREYLDEEAS